MIPGARPPLALTLGEPGGIGLDISIDAWLARAKAGLPPFVLIAGADVVRRRARALGRDIPIETVSADEALACFPVALPCLEDGPRADGAPGVLSAADAPAVVSSIRLAVELVQSGAASALVTNPIHKKALNGIGFPFPGHTEYLGALADELFGGSSCPVMMLAGPGLRVVPVTVHIPLAAVPGALSSELIRRTAEVVVRDLQSRFGITQPRLAVSGLNPHAGEDGMLGDEEERIIRPVVADLRRAGMDVAGPLSADTMFHPEARAAYDAALCMYHDQALIPIKTLFFDEGVNVTLGLPFIRTSPDHGTALPLAGTGRARSTSLVAALRMADALARQKAA